MPFWTWVNPSSGPVRYMSYAAPFQPTFFQAASLPVPHSASAARIASSAHWYMVPQASVWSPEYGGRSQSDPPLLVSYP